MVSNPLIYTEKITLTQPDCWLPAAARHSGNSLNSGASDGSEGIPVSGPATWEDVLRNFFLYMSNTTKLGLSLCCCVFFCLGIFNTAKLGLSP